MHRLCRRVVVARHHRCALGLQVLCGVSLKIYQGEAVGIIGASGTGKSTAIKIIAGLLLPDEGEVRLPMC